MPEVKKETSPARPEGSKPPVPSPTPDSFTLAHLSDLHLTSLKGTAIGQLLNKRILGYLSWWRKRRRVHRLDIVEALLEDLKTTRPDHIAVTGDLTHLGLPDEFTDAGQWLARLGSPDQVTVIPGNHEAYVGQKWSAQLSAWAPYLISDDRQDSSPTGELFPSLRIRGKVALIGLCSARPSLPFLAVGSLGEKQLGILAELLQETGKAGLLRVVLIHHPPVIGNYKMAQTSCRQQRICRGYCPLRRRTGVAWAHSCRDIFGVADSCRQSPRDWSTLRIGTEPAL